MVGINARFSVVEHLCTFSFDSKAAAQVDKSFQRALNTEPALCRLFYKVHVSHNNYTHNLAFSTGLAELLGNKWPAHLLTRDYTHRVFRLALAASWIPPDCTDTSCLPYFGTPYGTQLPSPTMTADEIKHMNDTLNDDYSTILLSINEHGDFGRYVLSPAIDRFRTHNTLQLFDLSQRAIFERIIDLGWKPEIFRNTDRYLRSVSVSRTDHAVERIGKKYQWIAFYELLGRLADNFTVSNSLIDGASGQYNCVEQVAWRDIDPTYITQKADTSTTQKPVWFSPKQAKFEPK